MTSHDNGLIRFVLQSTPLRKECLALSVALPIVTGSGVADDDAAQANNPLANMTAFNLQNYYIGDLSSSDDPANQFWFRYAQPFSLDPCDLTTEQ